MKTNSIPFSRWSRYGRRLIAVGPARASFSAYSTVRGFSTTPTDNRNYSGGYANSRLAKTYNCFGNSEIRVRKLVRWIFESSLSLRWWFNQQIPSAFFNPWICTENRSVCTYVHTYISGRDFLRAGKRHEKEARVDRPRYTPSSHGNLNLWRHSYIPYSKSIMIKSSPKVSPVCRNRGWQPSLLD